jgi:lipase
MDATQTLDIPVDGAVLRALRFGDGPRTILAAHGITASAMSFGAVARQLPPGWNMVALDLRGRGGSNEAPGPYGMDAHAADLCAVAEALGTPLVLTGQSMGAYAALRAAARRPELFSRLVLIDGGLPLPVPADIPVDVLLGATVGPAVQRLSMTFESVDAYLAFFRAHPALTADWSEDVEAYVRYDVAGAAPEVRSRTDGAAVAADGRDLLVNAASFGDDLAALKIPTVLLHAPRGMLGEPPGLLPQPVVDHFAAAVPALRVELVEGANHYTILLAEHAAARIVAHLVEEV